MNSEDIKDQVVEKIDETLSKVSKNVEKEVTDFKKKNGSVGTLVLYSCVIFVIFVSFILVRIAISKGVSSFNNQYETSMTEVSNNIYDNYFTDAEESHTVTNKATIKLGKMSEISRLEVLNISESVYVTLNEDDGYEDFIYWAKYRGEGIYTVDLSIADFLLDNDSHYILICAPQPVMTEYRLVDEDTEGLLFVQKSMFINGNDSLGNEMSRFADYKGYLEIKKSISSNEQYTLLAKKRAQEELTNLVKSLNIKTMPDIKVEVEFFD